MSELVERLHKLARTDFAPARPVWTEAADEIERLERELAELETNAVYDKSLSEGVERVAKEAVEQNAKLTRELAEARKALEQAKNDAIRINKVVSTFGMAYGMVDRIDAALRKLERKS